MWQKTYVRLPVSKLSRSASRCPPRHNSSVFDPENRRRLREGLQEYALSDDRVVAGPVLGSLANGVGDRWSYLDIMFAVADGELVDQVLQDWSTAVISKYSATQLFDLTSGPIIYRVFVLPDALELDLSFTPAAEFRPGGPHFRLLFGDAREASDGDATAPE